LRDQCSRFTKIGERCARFVDGPYSFCWLHDPTRAEDRRRAASKAGKSKPNHELRDIKARLSALAEDVLERRVERSVGAVVSQILNVYLRAISTEMRVKEIEEIEGRLEELEASLKEEADRWEVKAGCGD
jgi:hypothetical protein